MKNSVHQTGGEGAADSSAHGGWWGHRETLFDDPFRMKREGGWKEIGTNDEKPSVRYRERVSC